MKSTRQNDILYRRYRGLKRKLEMRGFINWLKYWEPLTYWHIEHEIKNIALDEIEQHVLNGGTL